MDSKSLPEYDNVHEETVVADKSEQNKEKDAQAAYISEFSEQDRRRILRKIDWRILPVVGAVYCIALIDRSNCMSSQPSSPAGVLTLSFQWELQPLPGGCSI